MPVTVSIPVTEDYREIVLPAGYADNIKCLLVGGDHLFLCTDTDPGKLLKVRKDSFNINSVVEFPNDTEHKNAIDAVYVPGSSLANDRIYVLFAWGPATPGLLMISEVNPNSDSNNAPVITNEDYVREEDFTPGVAGCLATDNINLYVLSGYVDPIRIATVRLSDAAVFFSSALSPHANGWVMRTSSGRLYAVGKTLDEFGDTWAKRIRVDNPLTNPLNASVETATTITDGTDFYAMAEDIGVSDTHLWIGRRGNPTVAGIIKKVDKSSFAVTDFSTGINGPCRIVRNVGSFIWGLYDNGKAVRITPSDGTKRLYTLNDGQGFQSQINTDADAFLYTAWNQVGTKIARYRIPSDVVSRQIVYVRFGVAVSGGGVGQAFNLSGDIDASNNVVVGGNFLGNVNFSTPGSSVSSIQSGDTISFDASMAKYNSSGVVSWSRDIGVDNYSDGINGLCVDSNGEIVAVGFFTDTVDFGTKLDNSHIILTAPSSGSFKSPDIFIAKYDTANPPHVLWARNFGQNGTEIGVAVTKDSSNNIYMAARIETINVDFGNPGTPLILSTVGGFDIVIAKFNGITGATIWAKRWGGSGADTVSALAIDSSGNVYVAGGIPANRSTDIGSGTIPSVTHPRIFIAKYSGTDGSALVTGSWPRVMGNGSTGLSISDIKIDPSSGDILITGGVTGDMDFGSGSVTTGVGTTGSCFFLARYTSAGVCIWAKEFGDGLTVTTVRGNSIAFDPSPNRPGNFAVTGQALATMWMGSGFWSESGQGYFMAMFNSAGTWIWGKASTGGNSSGGNKVLFDADGHVLVAGSATGEVDFGGGFESTALPGASAAFLASYTV